MIQSSTNECVFGENSQQDKLYFWFHHVERSQNLLICTHSGEKLNFTKYTVSRKWHWELTCGCVTNQPWHWKSTFNAFETYRNWHWPCLQQLAANLNMLMALSTLSNMVNSYMATKIHSKMKHPCSCEFLIWYRFLSGNTHMGKVCISLGNLEVLKEAAEMPYYNPQSHPLCPPCPPPILSRMGKNQQSGRNEM